jgi:long-chain acyl-CoA synthetase
VSSGSTLIDNLRDSARRFPGRCAIAAGETSTTYADLLSSALSVCRFLRSASFADGECVALVMPNSAEFVAAYYGTLMAGGIVASLNSSAKAPELASWLTNSGATWVMAETGNAEIATALALMSQPPLIVWSGAGPAPDGALHFSQVISESGNIESIRRIDSSGPANLLYTSGTTGAPKAVTLSHANLAANTSAVVAYLRLSAEDSVVSVLPFYYSYGNSVLHTHVKAGACLVLERNLVFPHAVVETLSRTRASGFSGVPSTFALLLNRVTLADYDLSGLRYLTQAGGAMSSALTQRLRQALPNAKLFVMYGQTEATARLTYVPPDHLDRKLGSAGVPVEGVEIQIRDDSGAHLATGETGSVWARGPNVMLGYWRNPAATAEVLSDGWLKTGDMGHLDDDGYLYLVGRRSDMIKAGAHRVHPRDIEDVIHEVDGVAEAAVVGVDDELLGQAIHAFVVPATGRTVDVMKVRAHCRERLANYKVPKHVQIVPELPKTASGKVRRHELPRKDIA